MSTTTRELLAGLSDLGVRLWEEDGQLRYRAPAGVLTDELRSRLKGDRDAVLAHLRNEEVEVVPDPDHALDPFPLTEVQSAYLLGRHDAFDYGDVPCQVYTELETGHLDEVRFEEAWNTLVGRHGALRTAISREGHQRVLEQVERYRPRVHDLREAAQPQLEAHLHSVRAAMDHRRYDPEQPPLYEVRLTHTDRGTTLHVSVDFLVADYLSIQLLLEELWQLYDGTALPDLEVSFRDYLVALSRRSSSSRYQRDRSYWTDQLDELPGAPQLPLAPGARAAPGRFRRVSARMGVEETAGLHRAANEHGVTASTAVLAAVAEVIGRWSSDPRFALSLTLLNREQVHPDVVRLVGDFTTVTLLPVDTTPTRTFGERAAGLQERLWTDMDHRSFGGIEVIRELARRRGREAALMPVVFTSTVGVAEEQDAPVREVTVGAGLSQTPQVWIDAQALVENGRLVLRWDVREGVLPDGVPEDMFAAMVALLGRLCVDDDAWGECSPLPLPAHQQEARDAVTMTGPAPTALLHDGVVRQALDDPQRTALVAPGRTVTYGELLDRARAVAVTLQARGVAAGDVVAVLMEKGWEQVVGTLGILLSGGAYLPLDENQPARRRDTILHDASVSVVLTQSWLDHDVPGELVDVDQLPPGDREPVPPGTECSDLAYVIYTSGSTGDPKGVMISHGAATNTVLDVNRRHGIGPHDRVLALASLGFDLSVYDIFGVLGAGGQVVIPEADGRIDPSHWADLVAAHGVTVWNSVPAQLQLLEDYLVVEPRSDLDTLRLALLSGDWIPVTLPGRVCERWPELRVVSLGGATEASIWSIFWPVHEDVAGWRSVPYGTPLVNQTFDVLDPWLRPCPDHVPGELYIGGLGLAEGYLGDEPRTAERFPVHPDGVRRYRTGDVGVYDKGVIEFLGRNDRQVKIRGHRIEPAETEAALLRDSGVAAAHVLVDGDATLDRRLVAFVVPAPGDTPPPDRSGPLAAGGTATARDATGDIDASELDAFMARLDEAGLLGMLCALRETGLFASPEEVHRVEEILQRAAVAPRHHRLVRRWLKALTSAGLLVERAGGFAAPRTVTSGDLVQAWTAVADLQREDWYPAELIDYFRTSTEQLPALLRDDADPLALLFPEGRLDTSFAAYRDNVFSRYANHAVLGLVDALAEQADEPLRLLEVGAGVGGTSTVVLPPLTGRGVDYEFTDVSQFFLNEARDRFGDRARYDLFDINVDLREQGRVPHSHDVILCANVLHNARDVTAVLARLRELLVPGGWLVFIETTRENVQIMTSMEFMMPHQDPSKWDYDDLRHGRDQTFLAEGEWREVLRDAGADAVVDLPRTDEPTAAWGQHVFAARFKAGMARLDPASLSEDLRNQVPEYMVPSQVQVVDSLPLTANGKVDVAELRRWVRRDDEPVADSDQAPASVLEERVAAIWAEMLGASGIGRDQDFYELGGDSLLVARLTGRLRDEVAEAASVPYDVLLRHILARPTVAGVAAQLESSPAAPGDVDDAQGGSSPLVQLKDHEGEELHVLVHDGVGTLAAYRHLLPLWEPDGPLVGIQLADGEVGAEHPDRLTERRARDYADRLLATDHRSFHVVGYCMGGLVATEVARQLAEAGAEVASLTIISSYPLPHTIEDELVLEFVFARLLRLDTEQLGYPPDDVVAHAFESALVQGGGVVASGAVERLGGDDTLDRAAEAFGRLAALPQEERLERICQLLGDAAEVDLAAIYRTYRTSMRAVTEHRPAAYAGDITFLREAEDTGFLPWFRDDMTASWRELCLGDLRVEEIAGDHFSCLQPPHVAGVSEVLRATQDGVP